MAVPDGWWRKIKHRPGKERKARHFPANMLEQQRAEDPEQSVECVRNVTGTFINGEN
jgi:hypothetical protein